MSFIVRLCAFDDVPELERLIPLSVRALQVDHYSEDQISAALGTVFAVDTKLIRDGTYFVAEAEGCVVACGGWSRRPALFGGDHGKPADDVSLDPRFDPARIRAFFVHPQWSRRGIGSEILRRSESAAIAAGFRRIDIVATLPGERLYVSFGYVVVERYELPLARGLSLPVVRLTKEIIPLTQG